MCYEQEQNRLGYRVLKERTSVMHCKVVTVVHFYFCTQLWIARLLHYALRKRALSVYRTRLAIGAAVISSLTHAMIF